MVTKCEGSCKEHRGEVKRVHVIGSVDWGEFNYCDVAIDYDRENGFDVEIKEQDD